uniref:riboflavin kinase n=1 Tax=Hyaloperonospora arabidopsidis (strain Emoy2) TaxID=559515 RepID=M4BGL9_HYAAE
MAIEPLKTVLRLQARVVEGFGRGGKQLGCPTANLSREDLGDLLDQLPTGIYCGWATVDDKGPYKAVASIGWNPYFKNESGWWLDGWCMMSWLFTCETWSSMEM